MPAKARHEGYMSSDHRNSPGIPEDIASAIGMPPGAGRGLFECATYTCSHCARTIVLNRDRARTRGYCPKCDHYVCDLCEAERVQSGGVCRTVNQVLDELQEAAARGIILPIGSLR